MVLHGYHLGTGVVKEFRQSWISYSSWLLWLDRNDLLFNGHTKSVATIFETAHVLVMKQFAERSFEAELDDHRLLVE